MVESSESAALQIPFCGALPGELNNARRGLSRWTKRKLAWIWIDRIPGLTAEKQIGDTKWAFAQWAAASNGYFEFMQAADSRQADILLTTTRLDGAGRVLADMQLPPGDNRQLRGRFDTGEQWDRQIRFALVLLHELGHAMGIDHIAGALAVLNAMYNDQLLELQPADVAAFTRIYPDIANWTPSTPGTPPITPTDPAPPSGPATPAPEGPQVWTINIAGGPCAGTWHGPMTRLI